MSSQTLGEPVSVDDAEVLRFRWTDFSSTLSKALQTMRNDASTCDVTLLIVNDMDAMNDANMSSEEHVPKTLDAHSIILSACSTYFRAVLRHAQTSSRTRHSTVVLNNLDVSVVTHLLDFMYTGEVNLEQKDIQLFLETAQLLGVEGLTESNQRRSQHRLVTPSLFKRKVDQKVKREMSDDPDYVNDDEDKNDDDWGKTKRLRNLRRPKQEVVENEESHVFHTDMENEAGGKNNEEDVLVESVSDDQIPAEGVKRENVSNDVSNHEEVVTTLFNPMDTTEGTNEGTGSEVKPIAIAHDPQALVSLSNNFYDCIGKNRERSEFGGYNCLVCFANHKNNAMSIRHFLSLHLQDSSSVMQRLDAFVAENVIKLERRRWRCELCDKELKVMYREVQTHCILRHLSTHAE